MSPRSSRRALVPGVAAALLLAITVVVGSVVAVAAFDVAATADQGDATPVALSLSVSDETVTITHRGGPSLDVRQLDVRVSVDGTPLRSQPPVPFFSAAGFRPGPTGPFNAAADSTWAVGETASFSVAGTNEPRLAAGSTVEVQVLRAGRPLVTLRATVR